jgi:hypothetical protein
MLIAQAQAEHLPMISNEIALDTSGVRRVWRFCVSSNTA